MFQALLEALRLQADAFLGIAETVRPYLALSDCRIVARHADIHTVLLRGHLEQLDRHLASGLRRVASQIALDGRLRFRRELLEIIFPDGAMIESFARDTGRKHAGGGATLQVRTASAFAAADLLHVVRVVRIDRYQALSLAAPGILRLDRLDLALARGEVIRRDLRQDRRILAGRERQLAGHARSKECFVGLARALDGFRVRDVLLQALRRIAEGAAHTGSERWRAGK